MDPGFVLFCLNARFIDWAHEHVVTADRIVAGVSGHGCQQ
jgi:tryptophan 2,3-dioxygenase